MAIIPLDDFKKAASVSFKKKGESYQQLLKLYEGYETVRGNNDVAEYDSLKQLLAEVNKYQQNHQNSKRNPAINELKSQVVERRYQVWHELQLAQIKQEVTQLSQQSSPVRKNKEVMAKSLAELQNLLGSTFKTPSELLMAIESRYSSATQGYINALTNNILKNTNKLGIGSLRAVTSILISPEFAHFQKALSLVELNPNSPVNEQGRVAVAEQLVKYPVEILDLMKAHKINVVVTNDSITTYYPHLKGVTPRGWPAGKTWDDVPGVGSFNNQRGSVIAVILDPNGKWVIPPMGQGHGSSNLVLHETAHAIDRIIGTESQGENLSKRSSFGQAWQNDYQSLDPYYQQGGTAGLEETFAEGIARYYESAARLSWNHVNGWLLNKPFDGLAQEYSTSWWKQQLVNEFSPKVKAYVDQQVPEIYQQEKLDFATLRKIYQAIHDAPVDGQNAPLSVIGQLANQSRTGTISVAPPPPASIYNLNDIWRNLPNREQLTQQASVIGKPIGESYRAILVSLDELWQQQDADRVLAAFELYKQAGEYIQQHPSSKRNPAIQSLRDKLVDAINEAQADDHLVQFQLDKVKAHLKLVQIKSGLITPELSTNNIQQLADGTFILNGGDSSLTELARLQKPFDRALKDQELVDGRALGEKIKAGAQLSDAEVEGINWYTREGYVYLNEALRGGKPLEFFVKDRGVNAVIGLSKLEPHNGTVYRALPVDNLSGLAEQLNPGQLLGDKGFLSTSTSAEFVKEFRGGKGTVIYAIEGVTSGYNISAYAQREKLPGATEQAEVLLQPGSHFRVKAIKQTDQNLYVVLEQTTTFDKGEVVRNIATGEVIGAAVNEQRTTIMDDVTASFNDDSAVDVLEKKWTAKNQVQETIASGLSKQQLSAYELPINQEKLGNALGDGIYEYKDSRVSHVLAIEGVYYPVKFDQDNNTWRIVDATNPAKPGIAIATNNGRWELNTNTGLPGGNPGRIDSTVNKNNVLNSAAIDDLYNKQNQLTDLFNQRLASIDGDISLRPAVTAVFDNTDLTTINRSLAFVAAHADYLASQAMGDSPQDGWLAKFNTLAELSNEKAFGLLSEPDQASIKSYLNQLNQVDLALQAGTGLGPVEALTINELIAKLQANTATDVQSYLLTVGEHSLAISAHQENGQWQFKLNSAVLGEINGISQPVQLQQVLSNYLNTVNDVSGTQHSQLQVAKIDHQTLAMPEFNGQIAELAQPVETTIDRLVALDETAGKVQIGELTVSRDMLHDLGATIDGKGIDSQTDFNDPELVKKLQFSQGKVQDFLHTTASDTLGQEVVQLIKTIDQARTEAGISDRAIVETGSPDHWLRTQLETISKNKLAFDQAKQLLQFGKAHQLSVELAPTANRKQNTSLADILAFASTQHQGGDVQALLGNQNRSRFVNELIAKNRQNNVEADAVQQYGVAQAELTQAFTNANSQRALGQLTIRNLTEQLTDGGNKTLALRSGQHYYLVAKQNSQLSFYDPKTGWISGFTDTQALQGFLTDYFSDLNRLQLGTSAAAFQVNEITPQFLAEEGVKAATATIQQEIPVEIDRLSKLDLSQGPLTVGDQKISRVQLWQLGAQIQGQPIAVDHLSGDWTADLSFNSKALKQHLSSISTNEFVESAVILKTLAKQERIKVENLVDGTPSRQLTQVLQAIENDTPLTGQHISQLQGKIASPRINAGTIKHVAAQTPGIGLQVWGIYSGLKSAVDAFKKGDTQEGLIQTGAVAANIASIPAEIALNRSLPKLGQRLTARLAGSSSRFAAASSNLGKLLGRSAGLGAALITLPFDIYSAVKAFTDAGAEGLTDKQRQDLYVQGGFAVAGAAVSLGLGVAALVTGSAALGPIGLGLSVALIVGTQIYSAVRQVEEVWNHVPELDDWRHRLRQGWLAFWGQDMDEWVLDAYKANKTHDDYLKQTRERSEQLLQGTLGQSVDTIVYGSFNVELRNEQVWQGDGSYKWEKFPHVIGGNDIIDARNGTNGLANAISHAINPDKAVLFNIGGGRDQIYGVTDKRNEFIFGQGNKHLIGGNLNDNFSFSVDLGTLTRLAANLNPDGSLKNSDDFINFRLDGQGGENTLTINTATFNKWAKEGSPAQRYYGYVIDLEQGKVWLKKYGETGEAAKGPEIGALANIHHTTGSGVGAQEGNDGFSDIIYGSAQSNNIVANFGDQVFGRGGNDIITLTDSAYVNGGAGQDVYLVQRGIRHGMIEEDGAQVSVIRLEFALEEITDWQLVGNDLIIRFTGLDKQLTVKSVYQEEGGQFVLQNDNLSFQTRDGFMLVPQLDKTRTPQAAEQPESIKLSTRYLKAGDKTYFDEETGVTIDLADNRIDGNNQGGQHQENDFEKLDKSQLIVLQGDADHQSAPAGSEYFIERGAGETVIKPQAQGNSQPATNKVFLNYDASEITAIETRYQAEQYDHHFSGGVVRNAGYHRKNYALVVTLQDGRQIVLEDIIDKTTHAGDALPYGGNVLRDFLLITRDGIAYSLQDKSGQTKVLATHSHYHDRYNNGVFTVNTLHTLNKQDYKLTDWQWGSGKQLAGRYQLSAEGTAFDDTLLGNADANVIRGYGGNDYLQGKEGHDTYVIGALAGTVTINNVAADKQQDSVIIGAAFKDISSQREGDNLVLTAHLPRPNEQGGVTYITRQVILENYFVSDDYRHISIVSNDGHQQELLVDEQGQVSRLVLLAENSQETIIDGNKGNVVQGTQTGDQIRVNADQSSTVIYANDGDDVITFNSSGSDVAGGGEGSDRYQVTQASRGLKTIDNLAEVGEDVLVLEQIISLDNLQLARNGMDLHLLVKGDDGKISTANTTEVKITNYYLSETYRHISLILAESEVSETELYTLAQLAPVRDSLVIDQGTSDTTKNTASQANTVSVVELDGETVANNAYLGRDQDDYLKLKKLGQLQQIDLGGGENTLDLSLLAVDPAIKVTSDISTVTVLVPESREYQRLYVGNQEIKLNGVQHLVGTAYADEIWGSEANNILLGGQGNDRIYGLSGINTLVGGQGFDQLVGRAAN
ncbi:membrane-targeted effector domain-containing toxin [Endozoicomonas sp. SM1973]|uniref:Membrane-targeted effector domain-containing toxin n=1 Tax=Spartinivicinus marinus TaxID=2994442 RepID=A0A853IC29_9GAMM|nr:membrane-targeted effector domain-containing toxin [Spartinivicinus marinus]MCX4029164.1 membrane-targeted effector domain-containing toxin [Spartinivicinus marinus]NYZ69412.1 membrane-targeted effector domain-containing toxin [Spartinivicinus marinus]